MKGIYSLLFCLATFSLSAQDYYKAFYGDQISSDEIPFKMITQVHSLDDFIGRYNGYHSAYGKTVDTTLSYFTELRTNKDYWTTYRFKIIGSLMSSALIDRDSVKAFSFAKNAAEGPALNFITTDWYVEIPIMDSSGGDQIKGTLQLSIDVIENDRMRWIIEDVHFTKEPQIASLPEVVPQFDPTIYIPPSAHDNGFIALKRILWGKSNLKHHVICKSRSIDILNYILSSSEIKPDFNEFYFHFKVKDGLSFVLDKQFKIIGMNQY